MVFEQVDGELNKMDYSTFSSNLSVLLSPRSPRWDMSNVNFSILRSNLSVKGDLLNATIPKMKLKLVHQQGQFIRTFARHSVIYKCCYCFHTLKQYIATLVNYITCLRYVHCYASQVTTEKGSGLFSFSRADAACPLWAPHLEGSWK